MLKPPDQSQRLALRHEPNEQVPVMHQSWRDLLFLHWRWDPLEIQETLPPGLYVDTFNNQAFLGVTPFFMRDVRPIGLPSISALSDFLELNVRTYVFDDLGRPGVWFYSLDCNQWLAVKTAQTFFHLPYVHAEMEATCEHQGDTTLVRYQVKQDGKSADFIYRRTSPLGEAAPGTLEFFLIERYLLFARCAKSQRLYSGRVHHAPYPLSNVVVTKHDQTMLELNQFHASPRNPDHAIASAGVEVKIYGIEPFA